MADPAGEEDDAIDAAGAPTLEDAAGVAGLPEQPVSAMAAARTAPAGSAHRNRLPGRKGAILLLVITCFP